MAGALRQPFRSALLSPTPSSESTRKSLPRRAATRVHLQCPCLAPRLFPLTRRRSLARHCTRYEAVSARMRRKRSRLERACKASERGPPATDLCSDSANMQADVARSTARWNDACAACTRRRCIQMTPRCRSGRQRRRAHWQTRRQVPRRGCYTTGISALHEVILAMHALHVHSRCPALRDAAAR